MRNYLEQFSAAARAVNSRKT